MSLQGHDGAGGCICRIDEDGACEQLHPECCCTGHVARVRAIALSRDGRRAVTGDARGDVLVWSFDTGAQVLPASPSRWVAPPPCLGNGSEQFSHRLACLRNPTFE